MFALLEIARIYKALKLFDDLQGPICYNDAQNRGITGLEIKQILRSPFGDQLEKYGRQMQTFSRQFVYANGAAHSQRF